MNGFILGMFAETPVHPGMGQARSAIDLPVAREAMTNYPVIPGSSLKGTLRDKVERVWGEKRAGEIFGEQNAAGGVGVTDARLVLLPVRSLSGHYRWITCPYLIERLERDRALAGLDTREWEFELQPGVALTPLKEEWLFLEELSYTAKSNPLLVQAVAERIAPLIRHESMRDRLGRQLVILHDDDFAHFATYGLPIQARNNLENGTKRSVSLWYEETLPPDCLFYTLLLARSGKEEVWEELRAFFDGNRYIQVGGNETIGQGWMVTSVVGGER
jgi:CRISPR-associated protein Cmr4